MYYINDGVYGSFNCNLYDHKIVYPITLKSPDEELFKSSVWGPTCDALDQVSNDLTHSKEEEEKKTYFENLFSDLFKWLANA